MYDDTGPIKKIQFIEFYDEARKSALTTSNIQSGWRGAGLVSFNLNKILASKQVQLGQQAPQTPLKSHKRALSNSSIDFKTPYNQKQLHETVEKLRIAETLTRSVQMALSKIFKGLRPSTSIKHVMSFIYGVRRSFSMRSEPKEAVKRSLLI
jgi:hypothetical protein